MLSNSPLRVMATNCCKTGGQGLFTGYIFRNPSISVKFVQNNFYARMNELIFKISTINSTKFTVLFILYNA